MRKVILASQSPRRRELLTQIGLEYEVCPSAVEEVAEDTEPQEVVKSLSRQKAMDVAKKKMREGTQMSLLVIGADTIVVCDDKILGKPEDDADAQSMLSMLQGRTHQVYTGVTLVYMDGSEDMWKVTCFARETKVTMYPMSQQEIADYVAMGEPKDKAGAYAIQGYGARFIRAIEGDYNNVVGLPVGSIYQEIRENKDFFMEF